MEQAKQERKKRAPKGQRTQRMMSFRLDDDVMQFLDQQPNKGRFINQLIRAAMG